MAGNGVDVSGTGAARRGGAMRAVQAGSRVWARGGVPSKEAARAAGVRVEGPGQRERKRQAFAKGGKKRVELSLQRDGAADRNHKGEWLC